MRVQGRVREGPRSLHPRALSSSQGEKSIYTIVPKNEIKTTDVLSVEKAGNSIRVSGGQGSI
jgi:hypothetical protein